MVVGTNVRGTALGVLHSFCELVALEIIACFVLVAVGADILDVEFVI